MRRPRLLGLLGLALGALAAGCGGAAARHGVLAACSPGERPLGDERVAYAASIPRLAVALRRPGGPAVAAFGPLNANGAGTVLGVLGAVVDGRCRVRFYRVALPIRPNGAEGYVRARDVAVGTVATRLDVDLARRTVALYRAGQLLLRVRAAIGSSATPTPTGRYYVDERLVPADPGGPFGPGVIGISAFSPVLTGWAQGGPIAIHGTNRPELVGEAVSNGCIRVRNEDVRRLFAAALAGTPVTIDG